MEGNIWWRLGRISRNRLVFNPCSVCSKRISRSRSLTKSQVHPQKISHIFFGIFLSRKVYKALPPPAQHSTRQNYFGRIHLISPYLISFASSHFHRVICIGYIYAYFYPIVQHLLPPPHIESYSTPAKYLGTFCEIRFLRAELDREYVLLYFFQWILLSISDHSIPGPHPKPTPVVMSFVKVNDWPANYPGPSPSPNPVFGSMGWDVRTTYTLAPCQQTSTPQSTTTPSDSNLICGFEWICGWLGTKDPSIENTARFRYSASQISLRIWMICMETPDTQWTTLRWLRTEFSKGIL